MLMALSRLVVRLVYVLYLLLLLLLLPPLQHLPKVPRLLAQLLPPCAALRLAVCRSLLRRFHALPAPRPVGLIAAATAQEAKMHIALPAVLQATAKQPQRPPSLSLMSGSPRGTIPTEAGLLELAGPQSLASLSASQNGRRAG